MMLRGISAWIRRASPPRDIALTIVGALGGWLVSHLYYVLALQDMQAETNERERVDQLVFRGIEAVGDLKYSRDASGKVVGVVIELRSHAASEATATADLTTFPGSGVAK